MKTAVFTISSANYFSHVQVLLDSLAETNPEWDRYFAVADEIPKAIQAICTKGGKANIIPVSELALPNPEDMKFRYDIMEFNTAIKPFVFLRLFQEYERVVYLDPDICVYGKMERINKVLDEGYEFILTPHLADYCEEDGKHPDEIDIMRAGIYNLGFFAASRTDSSIRFIRWWANRLEKLCINSVNEGVFVDQRWVDHLPARHERVYILRDPGYNAAYWNLMHRKITKENGNYYVNGMPLIFYHFSGFDPLHPQKLSKHQNRYTLKDKAPQELFIEYANGCVKNHHKKWKRIPYAYDYFSDGRKIKKEFRMRYREEGTSSSLSGKNPFQAGEFFYGSKVESNQLTLNNNLVEGVNLIGYIRSEHGVGDGARNTAEALATTNIDWSIYDWETGNPSRQEDTTWEHQISQKISYNTSIFNINADQLCVAKNDIPKEAWEGYRIGIWYWELDCFPEKWKSAFELVDEIWAPTRFIQDTLSRYASCPVVYMPPALNREDPPVSYDRRYFCVPDGAFLFLFMFDVNSYVNRKNPAAVIHAFQQAFSADDGSVGLVLKVNNMSVDSKEYGMLTDLIGGYRNIYLIPKIMTRMEINALITVTDAVISLHRSEGLGLLCKEAMYFGKPVIATNWSGNTDFMTKDTACLVGYKMIPVDNYYEAEGLGAEWAEADIAEAVGYMRRLRADRAYYNQIAENAKRHIRENYSPEIVGARMERRLEEIWNNFEQQEKDTESRQIGDALKGSLQDDCQYIDEAWDLPRPEIGSGGMFGLKRLAKRIVSALTRFIWGPVLSQQSLYNAAVTRIILSMERGR